MIPGIQLRMTKYLGKQVQVFPGKNSTGSFCQGIDSVFFVHTKHISVVDIEKKHVLYLLLYNSIWN